MHINKVSSVKIINLVAKDLGEDEDWLFEIAAELEPEDGVLGLRDPRRWCPGFH